MDQPETANAAPSSSHCSVALTPMQMKEMKRDAERKIRDIVFELANKTGLVVEHVSFQMTDISTHNETKIECTAVELDLRLSPY